MSRSWLANIEINKRLPRSYHLVKLARILGPGLLKDISDRWGGHGMDN